MNGSESRITSGEEPAGGSPKPPGRRPENGTGPRAFLDDTRANVACGVYRVTLQLGYRAVRFPCEQELHVLHVRCAVEAVARSAVPAHLRCLAVNGGAQHPRRDALEAVVQADPGSSQLGRADGRGDHRRRGPTQLGALIRN